MSSVSTRVWLITGCSAGLGLLLAKAVRSRGDKVIATARDISSLGTLSEDDGIRTLQLDVTSSQTVLDDKFKEAMHFFGHVDILVNNAGYILSGVWEEISQDKVYHQLDTNVFGPLRLTRAALPFLRQQGGGSIIFIGSVAGWVGAAGGGPYSVSKFALEGVVESLQKEVAQFNVQIYLFDLGQFRTGVLDTNRRKYNDTEESLPQYRDLMDAMKDRHAITHGKQRGNPTLAAERIVEVLEHAEDYRGEANSPTRVFLGPDCVNAVRTKCEETLKSIEKHHEFFCSTDYPESEQHQMQGYQ